MKSFVFSILTILSVVIFTSCSYFPPENREIFLPAGVWHSEEPDITLYLEEDYPNPARPHHPLGIYVADGETTKIFISFDRKDLSLRLYKENTLNLMQGNIYGAGTIIRGWFKMVDDEMHITLNDRDESNITTGVLIFKQLEEYEPIDPDEWFQK